jgi:gas vesicle protein
MSTGKVLLGVIAGVATGAALGVLLAPAKGSETRGIISAKGKDYTDSVKNKFDKVKGGITEKFKNNKEQASAAS